MADADAVAASLREAGADLGVGVTLRPQETDVL